MRLYDVGMALMYKLDEAQAEALNEAHARGQIICSLPALDMDDDEVSSDDDEIDPTLF